MERKSNKTIRNEMYNSALAIQFKVALVQCLSDRKQFSVTRLFQERKMYM